jgi:hypothetical protein
MIKLLSIFIVGILVLANLWLYKNSESKIQVYNENPPFIRLDFTHSARLNHKSKITNLFDKQESSCWIKSMEGSKWDLDLELKLTHILGKNGFVPRDFEFLELKDCSGSEIHWKWEVYLREAINVDKELRLPEDKVVISGDFNGNQVVYKIDLPKLELHTSEIYAADKIFILGIRLKADKLGACLSEIQLQ